MSRRIMKLEDKSNFKERLGSQLDKVRPFRVKPVFHTNQGKEVPCTGKEDDSRGTEKTREL